MINLVTVCGHNTTMLRHMLNHYKDMVDEIYQDTKEKMEKSTIVK